jgi:uracil-DNA glycosylase
MSENALLDEITNCPHARQCLEDSAAENPCRAIVESQNTLRLNKFQVPEPWSGQIEKAPILFLSSNPSIGCDEAYPTWDWSSREVHDYFNNRFGGGLKNWILDGTKSLQTDETYSRATQFWAAVRQRTIELLQRDVIPGFDYALTEIVHCKSRNEIGVKQAQEQCVQTYLRKILELAKARVIVVLGAHARQVIQREFEIPPEKLLSEPIEIGDHPRLFTFLPHPNARGDRSFTKCLQNDDLEKLRASLATESMSKPAHDLQTDSSTSEEYEEQTDGSE